MRSRAGSATLQPSAASYVSDVHPVFKAHLLLGMTIFLVFPFTRLVHIWSAPIWYLGRPGYQVVRTRFAERRSPASAPTVLSQAPTQPAIGVPSRQPAE